MTNRGTSSLVSDHRSQSSSGRAVACFLGLSLLVGLVMRANNARALSSLAPAASVSTDDASQENVDVRPLELGKPIERELKSGQSHLYQVRLAADQYLQVVVEQRDINLALALFSPDGQKLLEADSAKGKQGSEQLTFIAEVAGTYRLEVHAAERNAAPGRYEAKVIALRSPTAEDRALEDARRLSEESRDLRRKGKYDAALPPAERALAIREKVLGPNHAMVAESLHDLAVLYIDKGNYAKAEPLTQRALAIREKVLGPEHPDVAESLNSLGVVFYSKGEYAKAESFMQQSLLISEKVLGADHPDVATALVSLGKLFWAKGDYTRSEQLFQQALSIQERALGADDPVVAATVASLAVLAYNTGNYSKSESLYQRAIEVWEKTLGPNHPSVAKALHNLAVIYDRQRDYVKAEPLYQRALTIWEKALGPEHPDLAQGINNLADLYARKGDYTQAEPLYRRVLAIREKTLGPNHPRVAWSLSTFGSLLEAQGKYAEAESLYQRALSIQEKALGPDHPDVAATLRKLGSHFSRRGEYSKAEPLYQRAKTILEKALGPDHPDVAQLLNDLGELYEKEQDYAKAEPLYRRALEIGEKSVGPIHPDVAITLQGLAVLYQAKGDLQQSLAFLSRYNEVRERNLEHNLPLGSEQQKLSYLKLFAEDTDNALSLHIQSAPHDARALQLALTTLLRRKGRGLDATTDNIALLRSRADAQDQALFTQLSDARAHLAMLTLKGPDKTNAATYGAQLKRLEEELEQLEEEISARSAEFRAQSHPVTLEAVQSAIPEGAALVEFALYHPTDGQAGKERPPRYAAYVLARQGEARWMDLGEAESIDRAVGAWRQALRDPDRTDVKRLARAVDAKVMQPVRTLLGPSRQLLISPDGALNLIPFAALFDEGSSYLVERYTITYLTSGRDLLRLQVPRKSKRLPVVVADPAFGEPATLAPSDVAGAQNAQSGGGKGGRARVDYSRVFFGPLPGVGDEVRSLRQLLPQATFLLKEQATEAAVKRVSGPSILHIATHGFFLQDARRERDDTRAAGQGREATRLGKWAADVDNPLLRSGLALAGANQVGEGSDDGLLTALEVAGLDLWGTKLVVLSACDTGVGEVRNGDGVYGLRRALVLAGAESQTMSLWPVSDRSTRDLMIGYYKGLMRGEGRGEALRQVQLQMLRSKSHNHPYYWASFIHSGAWNNLEGR